MQFLEEVDPSTCSLLKELILRRGRGAGLSRSLQREVDNIQELVSQRYGSQAEDYRRSLAKRVKKVKANFDSPTEKKRCPEERSVNDESSAPSSTRRGHLLRSRSDLSQGKRRESSSVPRTMSMAMLRTDSSSHLQNSYHSDSHHDIPPPLERRKSTMDVVPVVAPQVPAPTPHRRRSLPNEKFLQEACPTAVQDYDPDQEYEQFLEQRKQGAKKGRRRRGSSLEARSQRRGEQHAQKQLPNGIPVNIKVPDDDNQTVTHDDDPLDPANQRATRQEIHHRMTAYGLNLPAHAKSPSERANWSQLQELRTSKRRDMRRDSSSRRSVSMKQLSREGSRRSMSNHLVY